MLNVGGLKVYNAEVERLISLNENVKTVKVYGRFNVLHGETVCACIELKKDSEKNREVFVLWCRQNITRYKVPKNIEFY